jgi:hypothetical protein
MNDTYNLIKDHVTNKPLIGIIEPECPNKCVNAMQEYKGTISTLVGWSTGEDPNHKWSTYLCSSCKEEYVIERKKNNYWLTVKGKLLLGVPSCFELYIYTCICGGEITQKGSTSVSKKVGDTWHTSYPRVFTCNKCNWSLQAT